MRKLPILSQENDFAIFQGKLLNCRTNPFCINLDRILRIRIGAVDSGFFALFPIRLERPLCSSLTAQWVDPMIAKNREQPASQIASSAETPQSRKSLKIGFLN